MTWPVRATGFVDVFTHYVARAVLADLDLCGSCGDAPGVGC
jgi:hypothetical protein